VVATPIGNLEDITLRALRVLREVDVVAAEDTRRTGNLLRHYEIRTPLLSLHEYNERQRVPVILDRLRAGQSVALVSDAGTPGISDPGAEVVKAVRTADLPVVPVPGPSTLAAVISVAGLPDAPVTFVGFAPYRSKPRKTWLQRLASLSSHSIVCFEAPHRLRQTLADMVAVFGKRPILVGREITKLHEEWCEGTAAELLERFPTPQGEFVILVRPVAHQEAEQMTPSDDEILSLFGRITETGQASRREVVQTVADRLRLPVRAVYEAIERAKKLVE